MKSVTALACVALAFVFAVGCGGGGVEKQISRTFTNTVKQQLKNPSSAQFEGFSVRKVTLPNLPALGSGADGYYAVTKVRATNSYGGVVPQNFQGFFTATGSPLFVGTANDTPWGRTHQELDEAEKWMDRYLPQ